MTMRTHSDGSFDSRGPVAWMTRNRITPNLLMFVFLIGGFVIASRIKQEVFPEFDTDMVMVRVIYPGSSPEEVEQGIILAVEEVIRALDGVKEITATASEGAAMIIKSRLERLEAQAQRIHRHRPKEALMDDELAIIVTSNPEAKANDLTDKDLERIISGDSTE